MHSLPIWRFGHSVLPAIALVTVLAGDGHAQGGLVGVPTTTSLVAMQLAQDADAETGADVDEGGNGEVSPYPDPFVFPRIPVLFPASAEAPGLAEFLASLRAIAEKRDDAALAATVAPNIFWDRDFGGGFDDKQTGLMNFRQALQIGIPDILPEYADDGWKRLSQILAEGRFSTETDHPGVFCTPVAPTLADEAAANNIFTRVNMGDGEWQLYWGYVDRETPVRDAPGANGKEIGKVQGEAVPVHSWGIEDDPDTVEIGMPDGRHGFTSAHNVGTWVDERLCFGQTAGKWSIVGYIGGGD